MKTSKYLLLIVIILVLSAGNIFSSDHKKESKSDMDPYITMIYGQIEFMEGRITGLAEKIPEKDYDWRPGEGVRSTGEQIVHMLSAAYFISSMMGGEKPDNITRDLEKTLTDKSKILRELKGSFAAVKKFLKGYDTNNYEKIVKTPFGEFSQRMMILIINNHYHEHLGSLITYGRANGVVPPWSEKQDKN